jgi:hypothetical protein
VLINFKDPSVLYASTARTNAGCFLFDINLHKSTDGGTSWTDFEPNPSPDLVPNPYPGGCRTSGARMTMDPIDPNTLYLPFGDDYDGFTVIKTTDGGADWTDRGAAGLGGASEINALVIDPNTPTTLYAATDIGVFRSTDGGTSFIPAGFANTTVVLLAIDPVRSNVLYAAASGSFLRTV